MSRQERVGWEAQARAAEAMNQLNAGAVALVDTIIEVLDAEAWGPGGGLQSPEHWVRWRTGVSVARAEALVAIARRLGELPACAGLFRAGRLSEDAMALIARKCPPERDAEVAGLAPLLMHPQLQRIVKHLPDQAAKPKPGPERRVRGGFREDGWWEGHQLLPPDEGAVAHKALDAARTEVFHERAPDADPAVRGPVSWADAYVRLCEHALDGLDPATKRGQARGERTQVIVHLDGRSDGDGQARIHLGPQLPDSLRRFLCCDAKVRVAIVDHNGALLGISPLEATVNPRLRAVIEQRDGGCRYPGCSQQRWVQVHHLVHREDGGLTIAKNLCALCPYHHRLHHDGLRFNDTWGNEIGPPHHGPLAPPLLGTHTFTPPTGEVLQARWFTWN